MRTCLINDDLVASLLTILVDDWVPRLALEIIKWEEGANVPII